MVSMNVHVRAVGLEHVKPMLSLYVAAAVDGTLGREPDEYDEATFTETITNAVRHGICLGAFDGDTLCGEIHASRLRARRFAHVFSGLSVAVHPDYQGTGVGRRLFDALLLQIDALEPMVTRVELMLQAGNPAALNLYSTLGFSEEGRLIGRVRSSSGQYIDDIQMARLRTA